MRRQAAAGSQLELGVEPRPEDTGLALGVGHSRRAILGGALGAVAALAVQAIGRPLPASAVANAESLSNNETPADVLSAVSWVNPDGLHPSSGMGIAVHGKSDLNDAIKGESFASDKSGVVGVGSNGGTGINGTGRVGVFATSSTAGWMGIWGRHFGAGYGVAGDSVGLIGVSGSSNATNQPATVGKSQGNSTGVLGFSGGASSALPTARAKTGVFGQATQDSSSRGVVGMSSSGNGVRGEATTGVGLQGVASNIAGYAIRGSGRIRFDKVSGVATIPAGSTAVTVTPGTDVTSESFLLLTAKTNIGTRSLYFTTDTTNNRFTIRMSSSRTSSTAIAWLLLS
jgi:hypothetical protein